MIIEAKRMSVGVGMKQCLLSMKDVRNKNKRGETHGFLTTGDGNKFSVT